MFLMVQLLRSWMFRWPLPNQYTSVTFKSMHLEIYFLQIKRILKKNMMDRFSCSFFWQNRTLWQNDNKHLANIYVRWTQFWLHQHCKYTLSVNFQKCKEAITRNIHPQIHCLHLSKEFIYKQQNRYGILTYKSRIEYQTLLLC